MEMQATILLVDDRETERDLLRQILSPRGHRILEADSAAAALTMAETKQPDVIMLNVEMPDPDGFEICRRLKLNPHTRNIPVIFVTARHLDEDSRVEALSIGGNDFIMKPYSPAELAARVAVMVRIKRAEDALRKRSATDDLTGLYSRRFLFERFEEEFSRVRRHGSAIACIIVDLDKFKEVNDTYGHLVGDEVLRRVAEAMKKCGRREDLVGRYGGEEFLLILPETDLAGARVLGERFRRAIEEAHSEVEGESVSVTASLGVAAYPESPAETPDDLVRFADDALYRAKARGRNQLATYEPLPGKSRKA